MKYINSFLAVFICLFQLAIAQPVKNIYVSPNGKDSNAGTLSRPFLSIERAHAEVRQIKASFQGDIYVYFRGGNYQLDKKIHFHPEDGSSSNKVIYTAFNNETPVFHGGVTIKNWEIRPDGVWVTSYDGPFFRQLYVNGNRRVRARYPDEGSYFKINGVDFKNEEILVGRKEIANILEEDNLEMILQMHWAESILRIKQLSNEGGHAKSHNGNVILHPDDASIFFVRPNPNHRTGQSYHFENSLSFLNQSGEWYLDYDNKKLYYKPVKGESPETSEIVVPGVETLIQIEGNSDKRVSNLYFEGITFMYSNWTLPGNKPYLNVQAGFHNVYADSSNQQRVLRPQSAIRIRWAENIVFRGNTFRNLGSTAMDLNYGTKSCKIIGNTFSDIAGGGILIGKFVEDSQTPINLPYNPANEDIISKDDSITNNVITRTGKDYFGTCGIAAGYTQGTVIAHNYLYQLPYTGISVGFGWTDEPNAMKEITVAYNHVEKVMNLMADGGGIYTLSLQPGTVIKGNYIHDLIKSPWASPWHLAGIYLDYMSGGTMENPMVLQHNFVDMSENKLYKAASAGIVLHVNNRFGGSGGELGEKIKSEAGLQPDYLHLMKFFEQ